LAILNTALFRADDERAPAPPIRSAVETTIDLEDPAASRCGGDSYQVTGGGQTRAWQLLKPR
jgi:hypothetical protein